MRTYLCLIVVLMIMGLAACGILDCTRLGELSDEELAELCQEVEDRTAQCGDGITVTRSSEQCESNRYREDCEGTVGDWRSCNQADPCDFSNPACGAAASCLEE